jgi:hypothetical protein
MLTHQVTPRYRTPGHVCFALPWVLCQPEAALRLLGNKLSIRYQEAFCSLFYLTYLLLCSCLPK